jgi:hypothetical protein
MDIFFKAPDHNHLIVLPKMGVEGSTRMVELSSCEMELKALVADTGAGQPGFEITHQSAPGARSAAAAPL